MATAQGVQTGFFTKVIPGSRNPAAYTGGARRTEYGNLAADTSEFYSGLPPMRRRLKHLNTPKYSTVS